MYYRLPRLLFHSRVEYVLTTNWWWCTMGSKIKINLSFTLINDNYHNMG